MSNIKINDVFQRIQYAATNAQTQFAIPFPFFSNAYVYVWQDGIQIIQGGGAGQYGITGAGSPSGGQITLVTPATTGSIITIEGIMPIDRTSIYSATISNLTGSDLNGDFNREVVMMKQIETTQALLQLQYAPWTVISQDQDVTKDRFIPLLGSQQVWRMNEAETEIEAYTIDSSGAPTDSPFVIYKADSELTDSFNLGTLTSGLLKQTVTLGISTPAIAQLDIDYYGPGMTGYLQAPIGFKDASGNIVLALNHAANPVNYLFFSNNATGGYPQITAFGSDANVGIQFNTKGFSPFVFSSGALQQAMVIYNGTSSQHASIFSFPNTAATQTYSFPDASGTIALTGGSGVLLTASIAGTTQAAAVNTRYIVANAAQTTITLPATYAIGDVVIIKGLGAGGWILAANTGDTIQIGQSSTTSGGALTSAGNYDTVMVTGLVANTTWSVDYAYSAGLTIS